MLEGASSLESVGAGIANAPNAVRALTALELGNRLSNLLALQGEVGLRRLDDPRLVRANASAAARGAATRLSSSTAPSSSTYSLTPSPTARYDSESTPPSWTPHAHTSDLVGNRAAPVPHSGAVHRRSRTASSSRFVTRSAPGGVWTPTPARHAHPRESPLRAGADAAPSTLLLRVTLTLAKAMVIGTPTRPPERFEQSAIDDAAALGLATPWSA